MSAARSRLLLPLGTLATTAVGYYAVKRREEAQKVPSTRTTYERFTVRPLVGTTALCEAAPKAPSTSGLPDFMDAKVPLTIDTTSEQLLGRFAKYATGEITEVAKFKKEKNGINVYLVKEGTIPDPADTKTGLPFSRIGEIVINAPAREVADTWWNFAARKEWDSLNTTASEVVRDVGPSKRLVYLKGAAKPMISPRDFVFVIVKLSGHSVGGRPGSYAFLQVNAADSVPTTNTAVRGNVNSLVVIEPVTATSAKVRYIVELEPKGWLPAVAVEAAADDLPGTVGVLKKFLESKGL